MIIMIIVIIMIIMIIIAPRQSPSAAAPAPSAAAPAVRKFNVTEAARDSYRYHCIIVRIDYSYSALFSVLYFVIVYSHYSALFIIIVIIIIAFVID